MFKKILIANRGEIARRVIRTCKKMGIASVAVYSEADKDAPFVRDADEGFLLGPPPVGESYLKQDRILDILKESGADALHPGYGLLSENAEFVNKVTNAGVTFIGPTPEVMNKMGDKSAARSFALSADVPVVPGSEGEIADEDAAVAFAENFGYPILVKAAAGGGGIGMKVATKEKKLRKAVTECQRRGQSAFGDPTIYLERYVENPRHIEIQVFGDSQGNAVHLFERECSVQRRHQKVIEETPSIFLNRFEDLRERMCAAAVRLVKQSNYTNAGTVEFIVSPEGEFYFIEMNTRLQVEHAISEETTGFDLVEWQIRIAAGEPLPVSQEEIQFKGHAIECRIYCEDPEHHFFPKPGTIGAYSEPQGEGIRVDSGVRENFEVVSYYDPMIAKVISQGDTRDQAIDRMLGALADFTIEGLTNNISMHQRVLQEEDFLNGNYDTGWLEALYKK